MIPALLALGGAAAYGLSDFLGGLWSRKHGVWAVALMACTGAFAGSVVLALLIPGDPRLVDFAWGALGGAGSGTGTAFLYRGLARGRMGVTAPISAVGAAVIPVVAGVAGGERPGTLVWIGIAVALPGIALVSREEPGAPPDPARGGGTGAADGIAAGVGFGLLFAAIGQIPASSGYWPLVTDQLVSMIAVAAVALALRADPRPRAVQEYAGLVSGALASLAVWLFLLATQRGLLAVSAVLTSLYPASTVLLAVLVLRERIHRGQALGLALCVASVVFVALG